MNKRTVTAATVGAVVAAALLRQQQTKRRDHPSNGAVDGSGSADRFIASSSVAARNARLAGVGAKAGGTYAMHRAKKVFANAERREELDVEFELKTAEQVAETLGQMKGALMKLGQMASYLDQGLPEHVRGALAELQKDAPPMSPALAAQMVRDELGSDPTELFAEWDPVPIASASIGQVHRAITHDGLAVAVKVQYPGVAEAMASDLANVHLLFAGMGQLFPGFDHKPFVAEVKERLVEELDYRNEARNQTLFADFYEGHPTIHIPRVVEQHSTGRVLCTELADGVPWSELLTWDQHQRNLAAETLYRFVFGSLYQLEAFNGDPHPGNYLFRRDGRITFLDFGLVKHFTRDELGHFEAMIRPMVLEPDQAAFRAAIERIGLLNPGEPFTDAEVNAYFGHFYEFMIHDEPFTMTPDYASETVRRYFDQRGPYGEIMKTANLPPSFVIIQRINLGLYALFGELGATLNFRRLAEETWPWTEGPPSTPMGEVIAAWEATRATAAAR